MYNQTESLSLWLYSSNNSVYSACQSTIESILCLPSSLSPDLEEKQKNRQQLQRAVGAGESNLLDVSYPEGVVPGTRTEGRPVGGNAQSADAVLVPKQDRDPSSF